MKEFKIADINEKEKQIIKQAEQMMKSETGKDVVFIAWQKNDLK